MEPRDVIEQRTRNVLEVFRDARGKWNFAPSLTKLSAEAAHEYADRFLIELIQNAYDAHPESRTDGVIHVLFDGSEGLHGTLYVANKGRPFSKANFDAICEIAQSDKAPGAGIGNKGVGFRSVLQVCRSPRVFSVSPENGDREHGFSFGFAADDDIRRHVHSDDEFAAVKRDVSPLFLPVPLLIQDKNVIELLDDGHVTVIALPIESLSAADAVRKQFKALRDSATPILLFLNRIGRLVIEERTTSNIEATTLTRKVVPSEHGRLVENAHLEQVDLGTQGSFILVSQVVARPQLTRAIQESIESRQLDERFSDWKGDAYVTLAVPIDGRETAGRLFTYLPMGEHAVSVFAGHLNAPFVTKLARKDLEFGVPLNRLFAEVAGEVCASTLLALRDMAGASFPMGAYVDLLSWNPVFLPFLQNAFTAMGRDLRDEHLVPICRLSSGRTLGSPRTARVWTRPCAVFRVENLAVGCSAEVVSPAITGRRLDSLKAFLAALGNAGTVADEEIGRWSEGIASHLLSLPFDPATWNDFYEDLALLLPRAGHVLRGRRILLNNSLTLQSSDYPGMVRGASPSPIVFFPPVTENAEDDEAVSAGCGIDAIPSSLLPSICFTHSQLNWTKRDGSTLKRTTARVFLQDAGLVRPYRTEHLLELLSRVSSGAENDTIRRDALLFAYRLQRAARSVDPRELGKRPFDVPTANGWRPSGEVFFSGAWTKHGRRLEQFISEARALSPEVGAIASDLVSPPAALGIANDDVPLWIEFLKRIGVRDGLWPIAIDVTLPEMQGNEVTPRRIADLLKLPEPCRSYWLRVNDGVRCNHPYTNYRTEGLIYRIPGQFQYGSFPKSLKEAFAWLVVASLGEWRDEHLRTIIQRARANLKDPPSFVSPVAAFLKEESWVPVPGRGRQAPMEYLQPGQTWHFREGGDESCPSFVRLVQRQLRRLIDESDLAARRMRDFGLRTFNDQRDAAARVLLLGELVAADAVDETQVFHFPEVYAGAWRDVIASGCANPLRLTQTATLVVQRGDRLRAVPATPSSPECKVPPVYVADSDGAATAMLLSELQRDILDCGVETVQRMLPMLVDAMGGDRVRRFSETHIGVKADDMDVCSGAASQPLIPQEHEWFKDLVALAIDTHAILPGVRNEKPQNEVQIRLERLRVIWAKRVQLILDGVPHDLPQRMGGVIGVPTNREPIIVVQSDCEGLDWKTLDRMIPTICQLIDRKTYAPAIALAVSRLSRIVGDGMLGGVEDEDLASAVGVPASQLQTLRSAIRSGTERTLFCLHPVVAYYAGSDKAEVFRPPSDLAGRDAVIDELHRLAEHLPESPEAFFERCAGAESREELRDGLNIDYGDFNRILEATGQAPILNPDGHEQAFRYFLQERREEVMCSLRSAFLPAFRRCEPLDQYVACRGFGGLTRDRAWESDQKIPGEDRMVERTNRWLAEVGAAPMGGPHIDLPSLASVRERNLRTARETGQRLCRLAACWCSRRGAAAGETLSRFLGDPSEIVAVADGDGLLDFEPLVENVLIGWLDRKGCWPQGMQKTSALNELGLTDSDLAQQQSEEESARRTKNFERRSIEFSGARFQGTPEGMTSLAEAVRATMSDGFLATSRNVTALVPLPPASRRKPPAPPGGERTRTPRQTDEQKQLVGFVGELLAHEWLRKQFPEYTDACWVSRNRRHFFGGEEGDDSLGYDFKIILKSTTRYFEVKATTGDNPLIELGASEVDTAQSLGSREQYHILFIANVLDPSQRTLSVLPNPFGRKGRRLFRQVGSGLRLQFSLEREDADKETDGQGDE